MASWHEICDVSAAVSVQFARAQLGPGQLQGFIKAARKNLNACHSLVGAYKRQRKKSRVHGFDGGCCGEGSEPLDLPHQGLALGGQADHKTAPFLWIAHDLKQGVPVVSLAVRFP